MNELIKITRSSINGSEVNSVNTRDLYFELGLAKGQYSRWIKANLIDLFSENEDYVRVRHNVEGNDVESLVVTLDVAKHLCMMSKTENAMKFRKYFIEIEKQSQKVLTVGEQIALIAQGHQEIDNRLTTLEQTKRLESWQEKSLLDAKNQKVYEIAKDDQLFATKLHRKVWSLFKKHFHLPRYNELPAVKFEDGLSYIRNLTFADMV